MAGSGGTTENHVEVGGKMNSVEDLGWVDFGSVTSVSSTVSLELFFSFAPFSEYFFSLGFDLSVDGSVTSSFAFPPRFFFEGPACRSFKNAETSVTRAGYLNKPKNEKRSSGLTQASQTHIVRFVSLRHEVLLIIGILRRSSFRGRFLLMWRFG